MAPFLHCHTQINLLYRVNALNAEPTELQKHGTLSTTSLVFGPCVLITHCTESLQSRNLCSSAQHNNNDWISEKAQC